MRLFVSVDLPDLADPIRAYQEKLEPASGIKLTNPKQTHVTLKFLGEVEANRIERLTEMLETAVADSGVNPFTVTLSGIGAFPSESYIQVIWAGVSEGDTELTQLHDAIEEHFTAIGFDPEEHEFTPHATIARMEHAGGKDRVQDVLGATPPLGSQQVTTVRLTESVLKGDGPTYETIHEVPLTE